MNSNQMTRRGLLTIAGAALAGSVGVRPVSAAAPGVRFGVRTPLPKKSLRDLALMVKDIGYDGIELARDWYAQGYATAQPVEELQKQLDGTGIVVSAIIGSIDLLDVDPAKRAKAIETDRQRLLMAKALKTERMNEVPVFGPPQFQDLSPVMNVREIEERLLIASLKELASDVEASGVTLMLEPCNRKETHFMNRQGQAAKIIEAVGSPKIGILSDFYHMQLEEPSIPEALARYGKYTCYVHLADGEKRTEPGSLPFDYRPGFHELKKWGYSGWLTMESGFTDTPEAALARALKYIKQQWAEA
jgi:sugar phosphate isomerase/epimerase